MPVKEKVNDEWWADAVEGYKEWYEGIHKFCSVCASETEIYIEEREFSTKTGNRLYTVYKICPKKRWWNSHDSVFAIPPPPRKLS
jgi:hypothetical protein